MRDLKLAAVAGVAWLLYATGFLRLMLKVRLKGRAVVLMYHRVIAAADLDRTFSHDGIIVEAESFEKQLRALRRHFRVVSLAEFRDHMETGRPFADRTCLVTFDDGWADNYSCAFPLLSKHRVPAVIFLPSAFIGTGRRFWQETLSHAFYRILEGMDGKPAVECAALLRDAGITEPFPRATTRAKPAVQEKVVRFKNAGEEVRQRLLDRANEILAPRSLALDHIDNFLSWEQVREMASTGIAFGSHTVDHHLLTTVPLDRAREELAESKRQIEREIGSEVVAFTYPSGDYDGDVRRAVIDGEYVLAFTTTPRVVDAREDRYTIGRINIHQGGCPTIPMFLARIAGVL